jgi:cellulose synthase/poly-beta-1,6-N-acetylglucosamine synthase-like glycosyltransferase
MQKDKVILMIPPDSICILFLFIILYDSYYFSIFFFQSLRNPALHYASPVSVIVPVYNNESTIRECIQSILKSEYDIEEIIVVNDGSTDRTKEILDSLTGITPYNIPHAGKAAALNYGIEHSSGDIVTVDADTIVGKKTVKTLVRNLSVYDAVAGNLQVSNRKGFLGRSQAVEHVRAAMFKKVAHYFDDIDIVPGPIGAFKREIFSQITYGTSAVEDMELTQKLREKNFTVGYEQGAKAYTVMPSTWASFVKQRFRWAKGNLELFIEGTVPRRKFITGYLFAFLDLFFVLLCLFSHYYFLLFLFFLFESCTMVVGNHREKAGLFVESILFPVFMLFFDGISLFLHSLGAVFLFKEFLCSLSQKNRPRT